MNEKRYCISWLLIHKPALIYTIKAGLIYEMIVVEYLRGSFNTGQRIRFDVQVAMLDLDVSQAIPPGLILNEAITNSIKYALPNNKEGLVSISLKNISEDHLLLSITDNGPGIPAAVNVLKSGSLGMSLMLGLSEDIDGKFSVENNNGTVIKIAFIQNRSLLQAAV